MKFEYIRARTLEEALQLLADYGPEARVLAGGTDLLPEMRSGKLVLRAPIVPFRRDSPAKIGGIWLK